LQGVCGAVAALMGQTMTQMGWAHRRRDHGCDVVAAQLRRSYGAVSVSLRRGCGAVAA